MGTKFWIPSHQYIGNLIYDMKAGKTSNGIQYLILKFGPVALLLIKWDFIGLLILYPDVVMSTSVWILIDMAVGVFIK